METKQKSNMMDIDVYNANNKPVVIDILSDKQEPHSGAINNTDADFNSVSLIRLSYERSPFDFLSREFTLMGKKQNLSRYFSAYQMQSSVIDIPISCKVSELDFKIPLKPKEFCRVSIYAGNDDQITKTISPKNEFYVVVQNTSRKGKDVNLIDLAQGINIPIGVVVKNSDFDITDGNTFKLMRILSPSSIQLYEYVKYGNDKGMVVIHPTNYFTAYQYQSGIIDIPMDFVINPETEMNVHIQAGAEVMYHFIGGSDDSTKYPFGTPVVGSPVFSVNK